MSDRILFLLAALAAAAPPPATAQPTPFQFRRDSRLVIYSPHFDDVPKPWEGLDCPPQPTRLFGFEGLLAAAGPSHLFVRVFGHAAASGHPELYPLVYASVRLEARLTDTSTTPLPLAAPWLATTDSVGAAELAVPAGIYQITVRRIGFGAPGDTAVVRLRPGSQDSLHVHMHPMAIC